MSAPRIRMPRPSSLWMEGLAGGLEDGGTKSIVAPQLKVGARAPLVQGLPRSAPADRCLPQETAELCSAWTGRRPVPTRSVVEMKLADAKLPAAVSLPPITPARKTIRFGVFEVDLAAGELRKKGSRVRLQEQPFQILACLWSGRERWSRAKSCARSYGRPTPSWISTTA